MGNADLGRVRTRMVDLEDHHEDEISVEGVMARLLGHDDAEELGRAVFSEVERALLLLGTVYARMGLPPTKGNAAAIGFLQGLTFAVAYQDVAKGAVDRVAELEADAARLRGELDAMRESRDHWRDEAAMARGEFGA